MTKPWTAEMRAEMARILAGDEPLADPVPTKELTPEQVADMHRIVTSDQPITDRIAAFGQVLAEHVQAIADEYDRKRESQATAQWELQHAKPKPTVH